MKTQKKRSFMNTKRKNVENEKQHTRKITQKHKKGGKIIGYGGYGCVFVPALKCKNKKSRSKSKVSKLMKIKNAESEYSEILGLRKLLKKIPNYNKYFIVDDIESCEPAELTKKDLINFDEKCKPLLRIGITKADINKNLDKLYILNIPNGGITVENFIIKKSLPIQDVNSSLIELLVNAILPMNKMGIYHNDVKESNILVNSKKECRLIDWGISAITTGNSVPKKMKNRPFQFNAPFSLILWNDTFDTMYTDFLKKFETSSKKDLMFYDVKEFIIEFIGSWEKIRGPGHIDVILSIISLVNENKSVYDGKQVIINYITTIVFTYTKNGKNNLIDYFRDIYLKNVDVWGFIIGYAIVLEKMHEKRENNEKNEKNETTNQIKSVIQHVIKKYLFNNPIDVINTERVVHNLKKIGF